MALQPAGTGNQPRAFGLRWRNTQQIGLVLVTLCVVMAGSMAQAGRVHWRTRNLLAATSTLTVSTNLPQGMVGLAYSGSIVATGGVSPYKFSVVDGSLQSGLYLNGTTGAVTGNPTAATTKYFWVHVTDAQGATAKVHAQIVIVNAATL